ncbi:MAG: transcription elongation factor GreAB [Myxococcales bacterium]|nr:transcription elongation factor GreAB [Myxococcales bacterium]
MKTTLQRELIDALTAQLHASKAAYQASVDGAFHDEAKPENDKDTRGIELSYLARGQAKRVEELETAIAKVSRMTLRDFADDDPISASAVVSVAFAGRVAAQRYFIAPAGGGLELTGGIVVVTPGSPLGRRLCGKARGDETVDETRDEEASEREAAQVGEIIAVV